MKLFSLANRNIKVTLFPKTTGRPPLDQETIDLVIELKRLNPSWGAMRISQELMKVGYKVSKQTVYKYLEIYGLSPVPTHKNIRWREFLENHNFIIGIDFTSKISLWGDQLFFFAIIDLKSRAVLNLNVTLYPNFEWVKQQFKNTMYDVENQPTICICDRDKVFSGEFIYMMKEYFDIEVVQTPPKTPQMNGVVERFHRSFKEESLANVIPINQCQTHSLCTKYQEYFNDYRPHQALDGKIPEKDFCYENDKLDFIKKFHSATGFTTLEKQVA